MKLNIEQKYMLNLFLDRLLDLARRDGNSAINWVAKESRNEIIKAEFMNDIFNANNFPHNRNNVDRPYNKEL